MDVHENTDRVGLFKKTARPNCPCHSALQEPAGRIVRSVRVSVMTAEIIPFTPTVKVLDRYERDLRAIMQEGRECVAIRSSWHHEERIAPEMLGLHLARIERALVGVGI